MFDVIRLNPDAEDEEEAEPEVKEEESDAEEERTVSSLIRLTGVLSCKIK